MRLRWVRLISRLLPGVAEGIQLLVAIRRLDRQHRFDVIEGPNHNGYCWAVAAWFHCKFVHRLHTSPNMAAHYGGEDTSRWERRCFQWLETLTAHAARQVVTHTRAHAAITSHAYRLGGDDIVIIPHVTPDPGIGPEGLPDRILAIANGHPRKGVDVLLKAFIRASVHIPGAKLVVVGPTAAEIDRMLEETPGDTADVRDRILAPGHLPNEALEGEWKRASVVIIPSRYESFGLVAIEAMARGKPILATNGGGLGEARGHAAEDPVAQTV